MTAMLRSRNPGLFESKVCLFGVIIKRWFYLWTLLALKICIFITMIIVGSLIKWNTLGSREEKMNFGSWRSMLWRVSHLPAAKMRWNIEANFFLVFFQKGAWGKLTRRECLWHLVTYSYRYWYSPSSRLYVFSLWVVTSLIKDILFI